MEAEQFYTFGVAQYECGNWEKALLAFKVLCAKQPLEARNWFGLGATLQESGDFSGAMNAWAMSALLDKNNPYPHFHAAECALSLKKMNDARLALNEAAKRIEAESHPLKDRIFVLRKNWAFEEISA